MRIIWTPRAANDLEQIATYIESDNPDAATRIAARIYGRVMSLRETPEIGRIGIVPGTRELIIQPGSYIVVYKISRAETRIILIRHAARKYP